LTNIQGYLESARLAGPQSPDYAKHLEVSLREARKLNRLVQDLFELSKLDTRKLEFHFETVSLTELADQVGPGLRAAHGRQEDPLRDAASPTTRSRCAATATAGPGDPEPAGKRGRLHRAGRPGDPRLRATGRQGGDLGGRHGRRHRREGPAAHLRELLPPREVAVAQPGRHGLGLAICKAIVDAHKGAISVSSRVGQGTTFRVELALAGPD
jgi:signal transduction histidine kinase